MCQYARAYVKVQRSMRLITILALMALSVLSRQEAWAWGWNGSAVVGSLRLDGKCIGITPDLKTDGTCYEGTMLQVEVQVKCFNKAGNSHNASLASAFYPELSQTVDLTVTEEQTNEQGSAVCDFDLTQIVKDQLLLSDDICKPGHTVCPDLQKDGSCIGDPEFLPVAGKILVIAYTDPETSGGCKFTGDETVTTKECTIGTDEFGDPFSLTNPPSLPHEMECVDRQQIDCSKVNDPLCPVS